MSLLVPSVQPNNNSYYFALTTDPGLHQSLDLSGNTLSISGGNSVNIANATTVAQSAVKLTAQEYNTGFAQTEFSGNVVATGQVKSLQPLAGEASLNGGLAEVDITSFTNDNPKIRFEKPFPNTGAVIEYDGTSLNFSTVRLNYELLDALGNPGAAGQQLQSSGPGLPVVWGAGAGSGVTAVQSGSNIVVDSTNPIAPIVNLSTSISIPGDITVGDSNIVAARTTVDTANGFASLIFLSSTMAKGGLNYVDNQNGISLLNMTNGDVVVGSYDGFTIKSLMQFKSNGNIETTGSNFIANSDVSIKGSDASLNFFDTTNTQKASINYAEINDKLTTTGSNLVFDTGVQQLIMTNSETSFNSCNVPINIRANTNSQISMLVNNGVSVVLDGNGLNINADPNTGVSPNLLFRNTDSGNTASVQYDGTSMDILGDINNMNINTGTSVSITTGLEFSATIPNETSVRVQNGGKLAIDNTGLVSGNDPILSLKNVEGDEATIRKAAAAGSGFLTIANNAPINLDAGGGTTLTVNPYGNIGVGGTGSGDGSVFVVKNDGSDYSVVNYGYGGSNGLYMSGQNVWVDTAGSINLDATNDVLLNASSITCSVPPVVENSTITQNNQLIPKSYLDNIINMALPAIAGYAPSTISNLNKNINKTTGNLTSVSGDGNIYFLYPFIDTTVSKIITYTGTAGLVSTNTATVGMSLIEYPNLQASTGTVVATVGNVAAAPNLCWKSTSTRYVMALSSPVSQYTLKAGYKYGVATMHNNSTTVQLLGFGMGNSQYSLGVSPYDIQTSATYTNAGVIPAISSAITYNPVGSGFVMNIQLEP